MGDHSYSYPEPLCYWVLLSPKLEFLYTSPAFKQILGGYNESLLGQSFLDYLEPQVASVEEIKQATDHLLALDNDGERAQMITIRYARLTAMLRLLSGQPIPHGPEHPYATFSFTISRAGNGVLGFLHRRSDGITPNIECGTHPWDVLHSHDFASVQHFLPALELPPPYHIFQVLKHNVNRDVVFTSSASIPGLVPFPTHHLAAATLHIGSAVKNQGQSGCMRRAKYNTSITATDGHSFNLTSVIIVLGSYLLVMHCLVPFTPNSPKQILNNHAQSWQENAPHGHQQVPNHMEHHTYTQPPRSYYHQNEPSHFHGYPPQSTPTWNPPPPSHSLPSPSMQPRSPYPMGPPDPHYMGTSVGMRSGTSSQPHSGIGRKRSIVEEDPHEAVPRTRRKTDINITAEPSYKSVPTPTDPLPTPSAVKQKAIKAPPPGVKYCVSCKTTDSPEWRKGPSGQKELCNACGLRWNRKQKKEATAARSAGTELVPRKTKSEQDLAASGSRKSGSEGRHNRDSTPGTSRPHGRDQGEKGKSGNHRAGSVASTSRSKSLSPSPSKTNSSDVDHKRRYELPPFSHFDKVVTDSALLVLSDYKPPQNRHPHNLHSYKGKQSRETTPSNSRPTLPPLFTAIPFETLPPLWDRLKNLKADEGGAVGPDLPPILNPAHVSTQELLGRSPQESTCSGSSGPGLSLPGMVERASQVPLVAP